MGNRSDICRDGRLAFELAPTDEGSAYRGDDRLDHDPIHHLPVTEALDKEPAEQSLLLAFFHQERGKGPKPIDRQEQSVIEKHLIKVGGGVSVLLLMFKRRDQ